MDTPQVSFSEKVRSPIDIASPSSSSPSSQITNATDQVVAAAIAGDTAGAATNQFDSNEQLSRQIQELRDMLVEQQRRNDKQHEKHNRSIDILERYSYPIMLREILRQAEVAACCHFWLYHGARIPPGSQNLLDLPRTITLLENLGRKDREQLANPNELIQAKTRPSFLRYSFFKSEQLAVKLTDWIGAIELGTVLDQQALSQEKGTIQQPDVPESHVCETSAKQWPATEDLGHKTTTAFLDTMSEFYESGNIVVHTANPPYTWDQFEKILIKAGPQHLENQRTSTKFCGKMLFSITLKIFEQLHQHTDYPQEIQGAATKAASKATPKAAPSSSGY